MQGILKRLFLFSFLLLFPFISFTKTTAYDSLLLKYQESRNDSLKVQALREIVNFWKTGSPDSIMYYSKILIRESLNRNDLQNAYKGYYWLINNYSKKSEYDSALHYAFSGLKHYVNAGVPHPSIVLLLLIGEQYRAMAQHENAITYLNQAWIIADTSNQKKFHPGIANRLASVYYEIGMLDSALIWTDSSISLSSTYNRDEYNISNLLLKATVKRDKGKYEEALISYKKVLSLSRTSPKEFDISNILNNIATTYSLMEDWNNVINIAMESYQLSSSQNIKALTMVSTELLANAYHETGNYKLAYKFLSIYENVRNDIFFEERDQQISELNTKYNLQQKENQIEIQKISIGKKEIQIRQNNIVTLFFIIALILLIGFLIFRYRIYNRLKFANTQLTEKNTLIINQKTKIETYSKKINEAYTKLQELDEYKQAFTNMLVHDLKNPLNSLVNIDIYEDESRKNLIVARTSRQMLRLITNLLDINKAENNSMKLDRTKVNLFDIIQSSFQEINYLCIRKDINFINKSRYNVNLVADSDILIRVFINLFTNAIKFSPTKGKIILDTEITDNNLLKVSVTDYGSGIVKKYHNTIFEKFTQINSTQSGGINSTGIGLAYCKLAIESHGWTIGVDSEAGKGAKFWILINYFEIIEDGITSCVGNDNVEVDNIELSISKNDLEKVKPYLNKLLAVNVYSISEVKKLLSAIKKEKIVGIEPWLNKVWLATSTLNEEKFVFLIKSLLK